MYCTLCKYNYMSKCYQHLYVQTLTLNLTLHFKFKCGKCFSVKFIGEIYFKKEKYIRQIFKDEALNGKMIIPSPSFNFEYRLSFWLVVTLVTRHLILILPLPQRGCFSKKQGETCTNLDTAWPVSGTSHVDVSSFPSGLIWTTVPSGVGNGAVDCTIYHSPFRPRLWHSRRERTHATFTVAYLGRIVVRFHAADSPAFSFCFQR